MAALERNVWKHARLQGVQGREGVCVGLGCRGPECDFADCLRCPKSDLDAIGDGAPPQDVWHRLWSLDTPGSPRTKFGPNVTVCDRHVPALSLFGSPIRSTTPRLTAHDHRMNDVKGIVIFSTNIVHF